MVRSQHPPLTNIQSLYNWPIFPQRLLARTVPKTKSGNCWSRSYYRPYALPVTELTVSKHQDTVTTMINMNTHEARQLFSTITVYNIVAQKLSHSLVKVHIKEKVSVLSVPSSTSTISKKTAFVIH